MEGGTGFGVAGLGRLWDSEVAVPKFAAELLNGPRSPKAGLICAPEPRLRRLPGRRAAGGKGEAQA